MPEIKGNAAVIFLVFHSENGSLKVNYRLNKYRKDRFLSYVFLYMFHLITCHCRVIIFIFQSETIVQSFCAVFLFFLAK